MTFLGQDLDQLSSGKSESLIHILCNVSRPETDHPLYCAECQRGHAPSNYENCFRKLENQFVENGFAYHGTPIDWDKVTYNNSAFKRKAQAYGEQAKKQLTK